MFKDKLFVCFAQGYRGPDKRDANVQHHRLEIRFGGQARLQINSPIPGKCLVIDFVAEHTHGTTSLSNTHFFRAHRNISVAQNNLANMDDNLGIAPKATIEFFLLDKLVAVKILGLFLRVEDRGYWQSVGIFATKAIK
ncbi:hypothetical protein ACFX1S_007339 [Malus domestica]